MERSSFTASLVAFTIVMVSISPTHAFNSLLNRASGSCPASYAQCSSNLPSSFCCPSTSTCVSLDNASSAICCPSGQSCAYIEPITCDVSQQNSTLHPTAVIKTTRLSDSLPKCGGSCCPFGYSCQSNSICAMDTSTSSTATATVPPLTTTTSSSPSAFTTASTASTTSTTSTASTASTAATTSSKVTDTPSSTDGVQPTIISASGPAGSSASSAASSCNGTSAAMVTACPSFPTKAIIAGFFPGAAFGVVLALLAMFLMRRRNNNLPPSVKIAQHTKRTSNGTLIGISDPIPSEENAYRTDFLLRSLKRNSEGARSMLQRTGTRVKSLFGSTPKPSQMASKPPPLPVTPPQQVRLPSTESIKVYTPPGTFASTGVLKPEPYPTIVVGNGATFTEMLDQAGFKNSKGDPSYRVNETPRSRSKSPLRPI